MSYDSKEISRVSPNLSLRLSPDRKFSPRSICCTTCFCDPCKCCVVCHCSPCTCLPVRCYSPCCSPCCSPCRVRCYSPCSPSIKKYSSPNRTSPSSLGTTSNTYNSPSRQINYNAYEEKQFNDFLRKLMDAENQIENAKISLACNPDFNCEDAFRIFELNGRGYIDQFDLKCGLNLLGVYPTDQEVRLLMKRFDLQKTGTLNYADFFDMLVPFEKEYRNMVENRLPNSCCPCRCLDVFCPSTVCSLRNLFNLIINLENSINNNRKLFGTLRLKLRDIFRLLDCLGCGYFTNSDLNVYLRNRGIFSTNKDADLLFIRLDKNRNGKIFYGDVEDEVQTIY